MIALYREAQKNGISPDVLGEYTPAQLVWLSKEDQPKGTTNHQQAVANAKEARAKAKADKAKAQERKAAS